MIKIQTFQNDKNSDILNDISEIEQHTNPENDEASDTSDNEKHESDAEIQESENESQDNTNKSEDSDENSTRAKILQSFREVAEEVLHQST